MKPTILLVGLLLAMQSAFSKIESQTLFVHFDSDVFVLKASEKEKLSSFIKFLDLSGDYAFQISGHTDHEGNSNYNLELSQNRSQAVIDFIKEFGVDQSACSIEWHGEQQLLSDARNEASMASNRRVELVFKKFSFDSFEEMHRELSRLNSHTFFIDSQDHQVVICKNGSIVSIQPNTFLKKDGTSVTSTVKLDVEESIYLADFLKGGLATLSGDKILKSAGMVNITATSITGDTLELSPEGNISIALPASDGVDNGFELFSSTTGRNWTPVNQRPLNYAALNIPEKPELVVKYTKTYAPKFDESTKPRIPGEPVYPRQPTMPRKESFNRQVEWYQIFRKKEIEAANKQRFEIAMDKYRMRMDDFEAKLEAYEQKCSEYPEKLSKYYENLNNWYQIKAAFLKELGDYPRYEMKTSSNYELAIKVHARKLDEWQIIRDSLVNEYYTTLEQIGIPEGESLDYYVFNNTNLGWANCDKFWNIPEGAKVDLTAYTPNHDNCEMFLVFPSENAILPFKKNLKNYQLDSVPVYKEGVIVAYKIKDGNLFYSESIYKGNKTVKLEYEQIKLSELKEKMESIGSKQV